jgi:hypothetical protein
MQRFRVNEPNVVFEAFDEEIVLVNLETGNYYSARGTGPEIWLALARGSTPREVAGELASHHSGNPGAMESAVTAFAGQLVESQLLVEAPDRAEAIPAPTRPISAVSEFEPPILESYSDMQDLLMLDPIHDVDAAGWPVANQA